MLSNLMWSYWESRQKRFHFGPRGPNSSPKFQPTRQTLCSQCWMMIASVLYLILTRYATEVKIIPDVPALQPSIVILPWKVSNDERLLCVVVYHRKMWFMVAASNACRDEIERMEMHEGNAYHLQSSLCRISRQLEYKWGRNEYVSVHQYSILYNLFTLH